MKRTDKGKITWPKLINGKDRKLSRNIYKSLDLSNYDDIIIACSGGLDSTVLAHAVYQSMIMNGNNHCKVSLAYINHNLRFKNEIQNEINHVSNLAKKLNFDFIFEEVNINKNSGNIQSQARNARYDKLCKLSKNILLAHHLNDDVETKLFQLFTNRNITGINYILKWKDSLFYRPFLKFTKQELYRYAKAWDILWVEDSSNKSDKYTRNLIRNKLIPLIENNINPNFIKSLSI